MKMVPLVMAVTVLAFAPATSEASPFSVHKIEGGSATAARIEHLNRTLRRVGLPGRIVSCTTLIDVSDARYPAAHTIGGICKIKLAGRPVEYAICDNEPDEDGGQSALGLSWINKGDWLVNFTRNNCIEQAQ
jgi:hypothetical protein